jgi:hypothetical protein
VDYFGATSQEASEASVYFNGFTNSTKKPGSMLISQYPAADVGAYLRGGNVSGLTLAQLQAITGVLTVTIDGTPHTSSSINLSSATSFSAAAELITNGLALVGPTQASFTAAFGGLFTSTSSLSPATQLTASSVTGTIHPGSASSATITGAGVPADTYIVSQVSGTPGGAGVYVTNNATTSTAASITLTSSTMDVSAVGSGALAIGQEVEGSGVTAGTYITELGTGTGDTGTYVTTQVQHVASEAMTAVLPVVTYDSVSGAFTVISSTDGVTSTIGYGSGTIAAAIKLTQATGAVIAYTQGWAVFFTTFDPDDTGNTVKQEFAAWTNDQNNRFAYIAWDTDITPTESTAATSSLGYILLHNDSSGTAPIYEPDGEATDFTAAFLGGMTASIDFEQTNGRTTAAFRSQGGLTVGVTSGTAASNLEANGYNYYGQWATAATQFRFLYPGLISGPFSWWDSYVNQIWLNAACQLALMTMLTTYKSIPYNPVGYGYIRAAIATPAKAGVNNGVIRTGVPLSDAQISEVNAAAGLRIDNTLFTEGWCLVIQAASATVRAARGSPTIILFYMDGESIQRINLSSVLIQ